MPSRRSFLSSLAALLAVPLAWKKAGRQPSEFVAPWAKDAPHRDLSGYVRVHEIHRRCGQCGDYAVTRVVGDGMWMDNRPCKCPPSFYRVPNVLWPRS